MGKFTNFFSEVKHDFPAGLVVFLVAVPLCLGIALASGAPLFSGIIAGIAGGVVISLISGSPLGVSGPAAGLTVIVLTSIQSLGSFETFLLAVVIAGILQILLGYAKAGIIGYYFPSSVIKGMLTAIGLIIILKQIPHALGWDADHEGDMSFWQLDGENTFSELSKALSFFTPAAIVISVISLGLLILWEQPFIKKIKATQILQGPLMVVVFGIIANLLIRDTAWALQPNQVVALPIASSWEGFLALFTLPDFSQIANPGVYTVAITLAVVGSLETLLSVEAIDKLDPQKRLTPTNLELKAQGIGNMFSGLIGGLPVTQVIVRSSANVQSGGKTKAAAFIHGILLLVSALAIPGLLNLIPLSSLAAVLIVVGYKLAKPAMFKQVYQAGWKQFLPFVATVLAILFTDLLVGIGVGLCIAVFFILRNNYKSPYFFHRDQHHTDEVIKIVLSEDVSFLNKASILLTLKKLPANSRVLIDASHSINVDYDVIDIINDFRETAVHKGINVQLIGLDEQSMELRSEKAEVLRKNAQMLESM